MNWEPDHIRIGPGKLTRWRLHIPEFGSITVEHHDRCTPKAGQSCPSGWRLCGGVQLRFPNDGERLKAKSEVAAKREAVAVLRKKFAETARQLQMVDP